MSDSSQGPGWWQASDGKWYAPESRPAPPPPPPPKPVGRNAPDQSHRQNGGRGKVLVWVIGILAVMWVIGTLIGDDDSDGGGGGRTLSEAFCADLDDGASMNQLFRSGDWDSVEEFAHDARGMMLVSCDEYLEDESVRGFLQAWGIDDP